METRIFDLESENEKLAGELDRMKGVYKLDEESLKREIE